MDILTLLNSVEEITIDGELIFSTNTKETEEES